MNKIEICNFALSQVGERPIVDLPPGEDSENSRRCEWFLRVLIQQYLAKYPWKFALREVELAEVASAESEIGDYVYELPGDCLYPVDVLPLGHTDNWHIVGSRIICDYDEVTLLYVSNVAENGPFPPWFAYALSTKLAAHLGPAVARENDYVHVLNANAREAFDDAVTTDANQGNTYPRTDCNPSDDSFVTGVSRAT